MESQRNFILIGLAIVSYFLFVSWQQDYASTQQSPDYESVANNKTTNETDQVEDQEMPDEVNAYIDSKPDNTTDELPQANEKPNTEEPAKADLISVETDVLKLLIDPRGGDFVLGQLKKYPFQQKNPDQPITILKNNNGRVYTAMSGLIGAGMPESAKPRAQFTSEKQNYTLGDNEDSLIIPLTWINEKGMVVQKIISLKRDSYLIDVRYRVNNTSAEKVTATFFGQLKRDQLANEEVSGGGLGIRAYLGAAYSTKEQRYERYDFEDMNEANLNITTKGGWISYLQHYFISAWVPDQESNNQITTVTPGGMGIIRVMSPRVSAEPGEILEAGGSL